MIAVEYVSCPVPSDGDYGQWKTAGLSHVQELILQIAGVPAEKTEVVGKDRL
jgi:hypothetical protein